VSNHRAFETTPIRRQRSFAIETARVRSPELGSAGREFREHVQAVLYLVSGRWYHLALKKKSMKISVAFLGLTLTVLSQAAENSPPYLPIRNNDLSTLSKLVRDSGPNARDAHGNSPLMYGAALGSPESMRLLLDAGADPNTANAFGATPLMWCAGDAVKIRLLLSKGAKVDARSQLGRTPLLIAAAYDGATEAARLLIENGADVNVRDKAGISVLEQAASSNHIELVRLLLLKGAHVNTADESGFTALMAAADNGDRNADMVKLLLEHGAAVNVKTGESSEIVKNGPTALGHLTPLHLAAAQANYEAVEALVKAGADVNAKDVRNATPLVFAVATDHANPSIVKLLLARGAERGPALDWVRRYQDPAILSLFGIPISAAPASLGAAKPRCRPREAITKALAVSRGPATNFLATGGCPSCHAQHLNGLAVSAAKPLGIQADYELETREARATALLRGGIEQQLFQVQDPAPGVDAQQFSLMQMAGSGLAPTLATDSLVHHIAAMQRKEGDWPNYGAVRPPLEDGGFSHTAKGIRALSLYAIPGRKAEFDDRIARAAAWLQRAEPRTTEDRTMQILGIVWAGVDAPPDRVQQLVSKQRADGGWGQTDHLAPDAYATGEALWALHAAGMTPADPIYRRGVDFLLRTQQEDGTWHVVTRALGFQPYFQSGFPYYHDQWISQAGTALATIALTFAAN
jgi:ankyrin repeat protein